VLANEYSKDAFFIHDIVYPRKEEEGKIVFLTL